MNNMYNYLLIILIIIIILFFFKDVIQNVLSKLKALVMSFLPNLTFIYI